MHILCLQSEKCGSESKLERFFFDSSSLLLSLFRFPSQQCKNLRWKFEPQLCEKIWLIWKSQIHVWKCKGLWRFWSLKGVCVCTGAKRIKMSGFDGLFYWLTLLFERKKVGVTASSTRQTETSLGIFWKMCGFGFWFRISCFVMLKELSCVPSWLVSPVPDYFSPVSCCPVFVCV